MKMIYAVFFLMMMAVPAWAQVCKDNVIEASTPLTRFGIDAGAVTDKQTGLMWMRCSMGQKWNGATCAGLSDRHNWKAAMAIVTQINNQGYAGYNDWRLPLVPELASIVERQCIDPRVNLAVFPATASQVYWTSMEKMGSKTQAYTLDFGAGSAGPSLKTRRGHVRLVRGGPWWKPPQMSAEK